MRFRTGILCVAAWTAAGLAAFAEESSAPARTPLSVRQITPIEFGVFASGNAGGTVTIDAKTGARSTGGDVAAVGGSYGQAEFEINGQPAGEVLVYLPEQIVLDNKSGSGSISLTGLEADPSGIILLDERGQAKLRVGATLRTPPRAGRGRYNGYFSLDARYVRN